MAGTLSFTGTYQFNEKWGVFTQLGYALLGRRETATGGDGIYDEYESIARLDAHYGQAVLGARYNLSDRISVHAGAYLGVRLTFNEHRKDSWTLAGEPGGREYSRDVSGQYERLDCGAILRVEGEVAERLAVILQFQQGFINVYAIDLIGIRRFNRYVGLGLSYRLLDR
jgi:hypothetical protein